jgi:hypothetical protein
MAVIIGIAVGISLILAGLLVLAHLSYETHKPNPDQQSDPEGGDGDMNVKHHPKKVNDCPIPLCVFQLAAIANHETWIVAFLMGGSAVLTVSVLTNHTF